MKYGESIISRKGGGELALGKRKSDFPEPQPPKPPKPPKPPEPGT